MLRLRSHVTHRLIAARSSIKLTPAQKELLSPEERKVLAAHDRVQFHKKRETWTFRLALLAVSPMLLLFFDAKYFAKKLDLPRRAEEYRKKMRKEHNIDHEGLIQAYQELDKHYGVSEKEEFEEMKQLGYGPKDTLALKQKSSSFQSEKKQNEQITKQSIRIESQQDQTPTNSLQQLTGKEGDIIVSAVKGKNFQRTEVTQDMSGEVPDPRIGGAKIMFDSRFDQANRVSAPVKSKQIEESSQAPKIMTFEQLGGKKGECTDSANEEQEQQSVHNPAYSAAKESFSSPSLTLQGFLEIQKAVENFKNQWKRENLYSKQSQRSNHNKFITWLVCGLEKEGIKLQDDLIWFLFFRSYEALYRQIQEPAQFYPAMPCGDIDTLMKETQSRMYKEHLWMIKAESFGLLDEDKTREVQKRITYEVGKVIQDIQRLQNQYLVKDNERRIGILEQLNLLFDDLHKQETSRAEASFQQQAQEVEQTFERGRVLMEAKMKKKQEYQNMIKSQVNRELGEQFSKGELPQKLIARDINKTIANLELKKEEARDSLTRLELFQEVWDQENNASIFEENKQEFLSIAQKVMEQHPIHRQNISTVIKKLELCCPGSRIPGVGKIMKEFKQLRKEIVTTKGTEREIKVLQNALQWIRGHILPRSLLLTNCRPQAAVLRKIENAIRKRQFEKVKRLLEENEVRRNQKIDDAERRTTCRIENEARLMVTADARAPSEKRSSRGTRSCTFEVIRIQKEMGTLSCSDRGKTRGQKSEEPVRELRIRKQENTPDYELQRCSKILRNEFFQDDKTNDAGQQKNDENFKAQRRAYQEGLIVQDIIDQWKMKEKSVKEKLNRRPQPKTKKPKRERTEVSDYENDEPSFMNNGSDGNLSYPQVTLEKIE